MLEIYVPFPPTINSYYVKSRNGIFLSNKGKLFRASLAESVIEQLGDFCPYGSPMSPDPDIRLLLEVVLFMPDKRKRDLDNYMKALLDAFTCAGLWTDDSIIDQLFVYRGAVVKGGRTFVRVIKAAPIIPVNCTP